ncbi:MAG: toxin, ParE-ParD toxin-antitoxin system [Hyphomicrobiales bacterium]|nr:MAG: toxin, ParE-ParD toxin-antitoxin system [Hyphomicrobiales bacterium]
MIYKIRRTLEARRDLIGIARYTNNQWGKKQLHAYMSELEETIQQLIRDPQKNGLERFKIKHGLRTLTHKNHYFIFYRIEDESVILLRVLHQRRNWQKIIST